MLREGARRHSKRLRSRLAYEAPIFLVPIGKISRLHARTRGEKERRLSRLPSLRDQKNFFPEVHIKNFLELYRVCSILERPGRRISSVTDYCTTLYNLFVLLVQSPVQSSLCVWAYFPLYCTQINARTWLVKRRCLVNPEVNKYSICNRPISPFSTSVIVWRSREKAWRSQSEFSFSFLVFLTQ